MPVETRAEYRPTLSDNDLELRIPRCVMPGYPVPSAFNENQENGKGCIGRVEKALLETRMPSKWRIHRMTGGAMGRSGHEWPDISIWSPAYRKYGPGSPAT